MSNDLMPESIRGGWYLTPADEDETFAKGGDQLVFFQLDETFERLELEDGVVIEAETGDYTFDGQFLILRGASTETFRVQPRSAWNWYLEGKKRDNRLLRGHSEREEPLELSDERRREIERLPMRVFVRSRIQLEARGEFADLVHEPHDGGELLIGHLYTEPVQSGRLWIGLTPLTSSLDSDVWEQIVRESYLGVYLDDSDSIDEVEVKFTDRGERRIFQTGDD